MQRKGEGHASADEQHATVGRRSCGSSGGRAPERAHSCRAQRIGPAVVFSSLQSHCARLQWRTQPLGARARSLAAEAGPDHLLRVQSLTQSIKASVRRVEMRYGLGRPPIRSLLRGCSACCTLHTRGASIRSTTPIHAARARTRGSRAPHQSVVGGEAVGRRSPRGAMAIIQPLLPPTSSHPSFSCNAGADAWLHTGTQVWCCSPQY